MTFDKFKQPDGSYVSPDGVWYDDAKTYLQSHVLGFCGCGVPEQSLAFVRDVLQHVADLHNSTYDYWKRRGERLFASDGVEYFVYYALTKEEFLEHGGCVPGWLTPRGKDLLNDLVELLAE